MNETLEEKLVKEGWLTPQQFINAKEEQKRLKKSLYSVIVKLGYLTEEDIFIFFAQSCGIPFINIFDYKIDPHLLALFPEDLYYEYLFLPLFKIENTLYLAMVNPLNAEFIDRLKKEIDLEISPLFSSASAILKVLFDFFGPRDYFLDLEELALTSSLNLPFSRSSERIKVNLSVKIKFKDTRFHLISSQPIPATCIDISRDGEAIGIETIIFLPPCSRILVEFSSFSKELEGEVIHCTMRGKNQYLLGVKFFNADKDLLRNILGKELDNL